jgi:hypothetical protein
MMGACLRGAAYVEYEYRYCVQLMGCGRVEAEVEKVGEVAEADEEVSGAI